MKFNLTKFRFNQTRFPGFWVHAVDDLLSASNCFLFIAVAAIHVFVVIVTVDFSVIPFVDIPAVVISAVSVIPAITHSFSIIRVVDLCYCLWCCSFVFLIAAVATAIVVTVNSANDAVTVIFVTFAVR